MLIIVGFLLLAFNFGGYCVDRSALYTVYPGQAEDYHIINTLDSEMSGVDIWQRAHRLREGRIRVPSSLRRTFESELTSRNITFDVLIDDVESTTRREQQLNSHFKKLSQRNKTINFEAYYSHEEINQYLDYLNEEYAEIVRVVSLGRTFEGRDLRGIVISSTQALDLHKPVFIVEAGIHGREWIAPATALYMIYKLVQNGTDPTLLDGYDWFIIPTSNPDGYHYSQTVDRLWRKTRSTKSYTTCVGVDANRNFNFKWNTSGSSSDPCSEIYHGPKSFSEPETRILRNVIVTYRPRGLVYLALHSYGSYLLYPYGHNGEPTKDDSNLHRVGVIAAAAIQRAAKPGTPPYMVGNSGKILDYFAAGTSDDYAYEVGRIKYSYTLELPGGGRNGFDPPPSAIQQTVRETWEGIRALAHEAYALG